MKTYIIAEAGVNHNGSLEMAKQLVDVAVNAGANAVKFQTFQAKELVTENAQKAKYQLQTTDKTETQFEMLKRLELTEEMHDELLAVCNQKGIEFLSTPFDNDSLQLLTRKYNLKTIKIPSGEITNAPFLLKIAQSKRKIILSTGMSTLGEVEQALEIIAFGLIESGEPPSKENFRSAYCSVKGQKALQQYVSLLHCTTEYPTPFEDVNLRAMDTLKQAFQLPIGISDHTPGFTVPIAAVARGATIIEKHFTLDRLLPGPDHKASLVPNELILMVKGIRNVEKALGNAQKYPLRSEMKNLNVARKSIVANKKINKGDVYTDENLAIKRPGNGRSAIDYWDLIGKTATDNYEKDEVIK